MVLAIWLPINYHNSLGGLVVFVVLFGFVSGAFVSLMSPALIEVAGGHTHDLGVMLGTFFAIVAVASLTGLPAQGAIADGGDNIVGLIIFCGAVMLVGTVLVACAALVSAKEKKRKAAEAEH
jgi:MFS family permease